jgi:hypothetical protein
VKVKELTEQLRDMNPETEVLVSSDAEGNHINGVYEADTSWAMKESYGRQVEWGVIADEDVGTEYERDDCERVVIIWPC